MALDKSGALTVIFIGPAGSTAHLVFDVSGYYTRSGGWVYTPVPPVRLLDSRTGNGLSGYFTSMAPRGFSVRGRGGIPSEAKAVTGNLTVTAQTALGYGFMAATASSEPTSSTLNFPKGDNRANGVTLSLSSGGGLQVVYAAAAGAKTHFVVDISGYFH